MCQIIAYLSKLLFYFYINIEIPLQFLISKLILHKFLNMFMKNNKFLYNSCLQNCILH